MRKPSVEPWVVACIVAAALLLVYWASLLRPAENPDEHLWKNAYYPFTVEISVRDR